MTLAEQPRPAILVVDDNPDNLHLLVHILTGQGYDVNPALSARVALEFLLAQCRMPDLMLLDIDMPGMNGYQLCSEVKANPATRHIPVIFISVGDRIADKAAAFANGGVDYVVKPFQAEEVLMRVEAHLAIRKQQQQLELRMQESTDELAALRATLGREVSLRQDMQRNLQSFADVAATPGGGNDKPGCRDGAAASSTAQELSMRELQILKLLNSGLGNREVATILFLAEVTVKWHLRNIFLKLGVNNRSKAIIEARRQHLV